MTLSSEDLTRIRELDAGRAKGSWDVEGMGGLHMDGTRDYYRVVVVQQNSRPVEGVQSFGSSRERRTNAEWIAWWGTWGTDVLEKLQAKDAEITRLRGLIATTADTIRRELPNTASVLTRGLAGGA